MYESRRQPVIARHAFLHRVSRHAAVAILVLLLSLGAGILGYMHYEGLSSVDAFLNAAMLLGGMGPVNPPLTTSGKLFAGVFALYAGLVFIVCAALILTPVVHRVLHHFHLQKD